MCMYAKLYLQNITNIKSTNVIKNIYVLWLFVEVEKYLVIINYLIIEL